MLLHKETNEIVSAGVESSVSFGIDESQLGLVFDILRSKIYSDPVLAVVRELLSNARDAHTDAGISDRPIQVTMPTTSNPVFVVQDFGKGMSPELINNVYRNYGSSLKTGDNSQIGGFGLGSKSPFALTDSFTVNTVNNGIEYFYSAYIDESNVGTIVLFESKPTDAPSGTTVKVPVSKEKLYDFEKKIIEVTEFWTVRPILTGGQKLNYHNLKVAEEGTASNCSWKLVSGGMSGLHVLIGEIPYRVEGRHLNISSSKEETLLSTPLLINIPIGSVDLAVSRESIQYTERSKEALKRFISTTFESIKNKIQSVVNTKKSYREAVVYFYGTIDYHLHNSFLVYYKGNQIGPSIECGKEVTTYTRQSKGDFYRSCNFRRDLRLYSRLEKESGFIINDTGKKRITGIQDFLYRLGYNTVYWYDLPEGTTVEKLIEDNPYLGPEILDAQKLSELYEIPKIVRSKVKREKGTLTAYAFRYSNYYISKSSFYSHASKTTVNVEDKEVYVVLEGKEGSGIESLFGRECISVSDINAAVKILGTDKIVYGVPRASVEKLGEGWVHISKALNQKIENDLLKKRITPDKIKDVINLAKDREQIENLCAFAGSRYYLLKKLQSLLEEKEVVADKFFDLSRRIINLNTQFSQYSEVLSSLRYYTHYYEYDGINVKNFELELAKFNRTFPLLDRIALESEEHVIHYIKACNSFVQ